MPPLPRTKRGGGDGGAKAGGGAVGRAALEGSSSGREPRGRPPPPPALTQAKKGPRGKSPSPLPEPAPQPLAADEFALPTREVVRPANQLALSEVELGEEVPRMLTANNPVAPQNVARFNMRERCYKFEPMVEQLVTHYAADGWLLHKGSDEAHRQAEAERAEAEAAARLQAEVERALRDKDAGLDVEVPDDSRRLRNQFNFSERAAQTFAYPPRDRGTFTEPPPTATASGSCSMWEMYDEYCRDLDRQRAEEASKQRGGGKKPAAAASTAAAAAGRPHSAIAGGSGAAAAAAGTAARVGAAVTSTQAGPAGGAGTWAPPAAAAPVLLAGLRILDRMVNQNTFADVTMDFKYWEDSSDAFRPGEGSLLPLWQFKSERGKRHVTSLAWSPLYLDQFAAGYGSFHYARQGAGGFSLFSLKNPSHAERTFATESGVMALHFHPAFPNLLAVGCYDGSVSVYDVRAPADAPLCAAGSRGRKHTDPVWQVAWQPDELQRTLAFVSISTDGEVLLWTLSKCELVAERLMRLHAGSRDRAAGGGAAAAAALSASGGGGAAAAAVAAAAAAAAVAAAPDPVAQQHVVGGLCMDFGKAPGREGSYLVGSEEGSVHICSKAYGSDCAATYSGHGLPVYAVRWNELHPDLFLSCSADWSVKVWDVGQTQAPLMSFDLGAAVGDAAWAPYSSTVFAAVTDKGRVHVYDLAQNRQMPLCAQKCTKKARLTRVAFNPEHPILLVGDSKGGVSVLKLSPNLRSPVPRAADAKAGTAQPKPEELERAKVEKVIEVARKSQAPVLAAAAAAAEAADAVALATLQASFGSSSGCGGR